MRDRREVKTEYRAAREKRAEKQKKTRYTAGAAQPARLKRRDLLAIFAVVLAAITVFTLVGALALTERRAKETLPGGGAAAQAPPLPDGEAQAAPEAEQAPVGEPQAVEEETPAEPVAQTAITVLDAPAGGWEEYAFTEEQVAAFNTVLDEWAASTPVAAAPETAESAEGEASTEGEAASEAGADAAAADTGHRVAVYFRDLDSGATYIYGGGERFDVASLSKAPYAMYLYHLVEEGQASLDETFLIDAESIVGSEENSGQLKNATDLPKELTLSEMIYYLLRYSDTVAQRVLLKRYPPDGYAAFAAGLGLNHPEDLRGVTSDLITAEDAGVYLAALKDYMDNGAYGAELQTHLLSTGNPMIRTAWPTARKYGWDEFAYHDMAVVYAPHPYLIAILTDKSNGYWADLNRFTTLPQMFEEAMAGHWASTELGPNTKRGV